jgi:hypothetical protein
MPTYLVIVQRDRRTAMAALHRMAERFAPPGGPAPVHVMVDRRQTNRRTAASEPSAGAGGTERRHTDRRQPLASTWDTLGFVIMRASSPGDPDAVGSAVDSPT